MNRSCTEGATQLPTWTPLILLALTLGLTGCVRYRPSPLDAHRSATELEARTLTDEGLHRFLESQQMTDAWPRRRWDFTALSLAAFYFSPELTLARTEVKAADAALRTAGQRPNPSLSVLPLDNATTGLPSPWVVGVDLDVPIETGGKRGYRLAQARHRANAARLRLLDTAWAVQIRVRRAMVEWHAAREEIQALEHQLAAQDQQLRILELQQQAGSIPPALVTGKRILRQGTALALEEARRRAAIHRIELARAVGLPATALDEVQVVFTGLDGPLPEWDAATVQRQALWRRADVLAALSEYAAADAALRLELARQYPDLHLKPGYEFDQGDNKWGLGLSLELPVFHQNQGPIAEAEARRAQTGAAFLLVQANVLAEIEQAVATYRHALAKLDQANALVAESTRQLQRLQARWNAGDVSQDQVAAGGEALAAAQLTQVQARADVQRALTSLSEAMQAPAELPLAEDALLQIDRSNSHP